MEALVIPLVIYLAYLGYAYVRDNWMPVVVNANPNVVPVEPIQPTATNHLFHHKCLPFSSLKCLCAGVLHDSKDTSAMGKLTSMISRTSGHKLQYVIDNAIQLYSIMSTCRDPHIIAAQHGYMSYMRMLYVSACMNGDDDMNTFVNVWGPEALWIAVDRGDSEMVEFLVDCGADPRVTVAVGKNYSAIEHMAGRGEIGMLKYLRNEKYYDIQPSPTCRSLSLAARWGHVDIVKYLIQIGSEAEYTSRIMTGISRNVRHVDAPYLVPPGYDEDEDSNSAQRRPPPVVKTSRHDFLPVWMSSSECREAVRTAAAWGHVRVLELLLEWGANVHGEGETPLLEASIRNQLESVKCLVNHGADVRAAHDKALRWACEGGNLEVVKYLIECGCRHSSFNGGALTFACKRNQTVIIEYLLSLDVNVHADSETAITSAASSGFIESVDLLLKAKANPRGGVLRPDIPNPEAQEMLRSIPYDDPKQNSVPRSNIPLRNAVWGGYLNVVCRLLNARAATVYNIDTGEYSPDTEMLSQVVQVAKRRRHWNVLAELVRRKAPTTSLTIVERMALFTYMHYDNMLYIAATIALLTIISY